MNTTRKLFALALVLSPSLVLAASSSSQGYFRQDTAKALLSNFTKHYLGLPKAYVQTAFGGWKGSSGLRPGAALKHKTMAAIGGTAKVNGKAAEIVAAAAQAALAVKGKDDQIRAISAGGLTGALRVTLEDTKFPSSAKDAHKIFDGVFGSELRNGIKFRKYNFSGTDVWRAENWMPGPDGLKQVRHGYWVSNYGGKTRAGTGMGTGIVAGYMPLY